MPHDDYFSRRDLVRLAALLTAGGAAPLLSACAKRERDPDAPLRIGYLPITDATPLLVAHGRGLFQAEGLEVAKPVMFRGWSQIAEAFMAGEVDIVHLLSPITVWARFGSKMPAKVVAWNHMSGSGLSVAKDIADVKQLGGRTVAIPFWYSIHNVVLQDILRANGLTPVMKRTGQPAANEVNLAVMAPADMVPALASGRIAGYTVAEPFNATSELLGVGRIMRFTGDVWRDHACCVLTMHERDLSERPEWSQKVVNAVVKAQLWTRGHRAETAALLSKSNPARYTPHEEKVLRKVLAPDPADTAAYVASGAIRHPEWREKRVDFQPFPYPSYTETLIAKLKTTVIDGDRRFLDTLDPAKAAGELVDDRFVRTAIAGVGGMAAFGMPDGFTRTETIAA